MLSIQVLPPSQPLTVPWLSKKEYFVYDIIEIFAFSYCDRHLASGEGVLLFYYVSIVSTRDIVPRWRDLTFGTDKVSVILDVNEMVSNETRHCGLNNGCIEQPLLLLKMIASCYLLFKL
ncbi:unnamed protein product [Danaus chrysippus]|uniref:(African queen) hypothetical protein n=1 Tax=Danaus chrysippus TaxID=151541 RepID=A0A8J2QMQ7_9NEOP|nr:unnamed protein product [Danaus chrysippus]